MALTTQQLTTFKKITDPLRLHGPLGRVLHNRAVFSDQGLKALWLERILCLNEIEFRAELDILYAMNSRSRLAYEALFIDLLDLHALVHGTLQIKRKVIDTVPSEQPINWLGMVGAQERLWEEPYPDGPTIYAKTRERITEILIDIYRDTPNIKTLQAAWLTKEASYYPNTYWRRMGDRIENCINEVDEGLIYNNPYQSFNYIFNSLMRGSNVTSHAYGQLSKFSLLNSQITERPQRASSNHANRRALEAIITTKMQALSARLFEQALPETLTRNVPFDMSFTLKQQGVISLFQAKVPGGMPSLLKQYTLEHTRALKIEALSQVHGPVSLGFNLTDVHGNKHLFTKLVPVKDSVIGSMTLPDESEVATSYAIHFTHPLSGRLLLKREDQIVREIPIINTLVANIIFQVEEIGQLQIELIINNNETSLKKLIHVLPRRAVDVQTNPDRSLARHMETLSQNDNAGADFNYVDAQHNAQRKEVSESVNSSLERLLSRYSTAITTVAKTRMFNEVADYLNAEQQNSRTKKLRLIPTPEDFRPPWTLDPSARNNVPFPDGVSYVEKNIAEIAARTLPRLKTEGIFSAPVNLKTHDNVMALVWAGITDPNANITGVRFTNEDILARKRILMDHLLQIQRGYNLNDAGHDNGYFDDFPICAKGTRNTLVETLDLIHPDVEIIRSGLELAQNLARETASAYFLTLPYSIQASILSDDATPGTEAQVEDFYATLTRKTREVLTAKLNNILSDTQRNEILDNLIYIPLPEVRDMSALSRPRP